MKLKKIMLENIRSHKKTELEIKDGITVIMGRTGSGKSSLLMAIEFALFGTEGLNKDLIFRRGSSFCRVILEFVHNNKKYKIIRGLKKSGKDIIWDPNNLGIWENERRLPVFERVRDINEKIKEILGLPTKLNGSEIFEVLVYTKQDEIRKLLEIKKEKRQEYIDKILYLSKYKKAWENLRGVIDVFERDLDVYKARISSMDELKLDIERLELNFKSKQEELENYKKEVSKLEGEYDNIYRERLNLENKLKELLNKKEKIDKMMGKISSLKEDIQRLREELVDLRNRVKNVKKPEGLEKREERFQKISMELAVLNKEINNKLKEKNEILSLKGICPLCKQPISEDHIIKLKTKYEEEVKNLELKKNNLEREKEKLRKEINELKKLEEIWKENEKIIFLIKNKENILSEKEKLLKELELEIREIDYSENEYEIVRKNYEEIIKKERELIGKLESLKNLKERISRELDYINKELEEKRKKYKEAIQIKEKIGKTESIINLLKRLREDIRSIREIIREKFLEDFRNEFQRRFEEIRQESEYVVDIKSDYEPIAYDGKGREVPISHLSGGEKTSVALAYRLALSNLASQLMGISKPEILILDEPTVGFDREDVKILPEVLRNVKNIPQIIIVTHEEELKEAADYKYIVYKENGVSIVKEV